MGCVSIESLCRFRNLSEVPSHRQLRNSELLEQLRKAVDFRYIAVGGLDLEGYRIGRGCSIDTDMPPAYIDSYFGEKLGLSDPLVVQSLHRTTPLTEEEAFAIMAPSQRLRYRLRSYGIGQRVGSVSPEKNRSRQASWNYLCSFSNLCIGRSPNR